MKSILLIGLGIYGRYVAEELSKMKAEVLAIDKNEDKVNAVLPYVTDARIGDCTDASFLGSLGVQDFDVCIVGISGNFQSSLEITYLLKKLGAKKVISRASKDIQAELLMNSGADEVVYPQQQSAHWTAIKYSSEEILDYMDLNGVYAIFEIKTPKDWVGKSLAELDVRKRYNMNIVAVKENGEMNLTFAPDRAFKEADSILVVGIESDIMKRLQE